MVGASFMILAPGQLSRLQGAGGIGGVYSCLRRAIFITFDLLDYLKSLIILVAILIIFLNIITDMVKMNF